MRPVTTRCLARGGARRGRGITRFLTRAKRAAEKRGYPRRGRSPCPGAVRCVVGVAHFEAPLAVPRGGSFHRVTPNGCYTDGSSNEVGYIRSSSAKGLAHGAMLFGGAAWNRTGKITGRVTFDFGERNCRAHPVHARREEGSGFDPAVCLKAATRPWMSP
jgi:hypothetical protein